MPLVVVCGYPCSGKTTFAKQLEQFLRQQPGIDDVALINEESEKILKRTGYADSFAEKITRAVGTPMCVCVMSVKDQQHCLRWNQLRNDRGEDSFDPLLMEAMINRFEHPIEKNRWDSPLFTIKNIPLDVIIAPEAFSGASSLTTVIDATTTVDATEATGPDVAGPDVKKPVTSSWKAKVKKPSQAVVVGSEAVTPVAIENTLKSFTIASPAVVAPVAAGGAVSSSLSRATAGTKSACELDADSACASVLQYLQTATVAAPNSSTVAVPHGAPDLLYTLTQTTDGISRRIVAHQRECPQEGSALVFPEYNRSFSLHRIVSIAEITRVRQQFVRTNAHTSFGSPEDVGSAFIDYLAGIL